MPVDASTALKNSADALAAIVEALAHISETTMAPTNRVDFDELKGRAGSLSSDVRAAISALAPPTAHVISQAQVAPTRNAFTSPVKKASDVETTLTTIDRSQLDAKTKALIDTLQLRAARLSVDVLDAQGRFHTS